MRLHQGYLLLWVMQQIQGELPERCTKRGHCPFRSPELARDQTVLVVLGRNGPMAVDFVVPVELLEGPECPEHP